MSISDPEPRPTKVVVDEAQYDEAEVDLWLHGSIIKQLIKTLTAERDQQAAEHYYGIAEGLKIALDALEKVLEDEEKEES